jgi:stearoyl-CoA desaturase (delta-9 desaturase)
VYIAACVTVFLAAYLLNIVTISVGYHRGLAHGAVHLGPRAKRWLVTMGNWITGLDPKAWVVMHRLHHAHSDTPLDPHSPVQVGLLGIARAQLKSYERVIRGLAKRDPAYTRYAVDLDFKLSLMNRRGFWFAPYVLHAVIGVVLGVAVGPLLGAAYFFGMMSHPIQGGLVNAFGHAVGGRNFDTDDNSRNNHPIAWLILGEGFQNNHHHAPASARFSYAAHEIDPGWAVCLILDAMGVVEVQHSSVLPRKRGLAAAPVRGDAFDAATAPS